MTANCPNSHLVFPPREWSRFENRCAYSLTNPLENLNSQKTKYVPFVDNIFNPSDYIYQQAVFNKGNVLQYKKNSSNLTKQQRYAQIAKAMWTNRSITWATQGIIYSNSNTNSLKRVGYTSFDVTNGQTTSTQGITCPPTPSNPTFSSLPNRNTTVNTSQPIIPPINQSTLNSPIIPVITEPAAITSIIIPDGGSLICNVSENICTNEIYDVTHTRDCYLNDVSDVPGSPTLLCWNDGYQTFYPKTKLTYGTSGNKWPTNSKFIKSALTVSTKPTNFVVTPVTGTGSFNLSWDKPIYTGGLAIEYYLITVVSTSLSYYNSLESVKTNAVISQLENGVEYTFSVAAVNVIGFGNPTYQNSTCLNNEIKIEYNNTITLQD